ncbi:LLM class F420-dependent oxidoreductase [Amycolatopsis sp. WQ 127309]|uniref:LLM class F420-dependent oxidoreductase n=1 Tax=Amycolatopsis sp. WQ 127309 TaxID=2932773 RepID=UPI001FF486C2|nr:LLM class F420-dependent oxidoreductase [Amycolatopsis sp. WQ 127309]UOZ06758.1 LLM class F420-dependent oxidoreductase [Amycolatopsis sp. WQ 127309]
MRLSVSLGLWQDRPPEEALETARAAEAAGYPELWIGEMATWDAFALGTAIGASTSLSLTFGPLAVTVRDPATIAMGVASVAALTGRETGVALGTSSDVVVRGWHGRSRDHAATALEESAVAVRQLLAGAKSAVDGSVVGSRGYRLRLPAPKSPLTIAAFGPRALDVAARHADRMVVNLVSPAAAAALVQGLHAAASRAGTTPPPVAAWVVGALEPSPAAIEQLRRGVVGYLAAPGYADMFRAEGFGDLVDFARTRPHPRELLAAVPVEAIAAVGLLGSRDDIARKIADFAAAGVDELAIVPATSDEDPGGARTLAACRIGVSSFDVEV